jgi:hypothetical protein
VGTGTTWLRRELCEEMTPEYLTICRRGGGTKAAKRAMSASGARSMDEVPSDQGRLNSSRTFPSSRIFRRSLARGGRKIVERQLHLPIGDDYIAPS